MDNFKNKLLTWYKEPRTPPEVNDPPERATNPKRSSNLGGGVGEYAKP